MTRVSLFLADDSAPQVNLSPGLLTVAAIIIGVLLLVGLLVGLIVYRRLKRSGQLRRLTMTVEAEARPPGPKRDLAELAIELEGALTGARSAAWAPCRAPARALVEPGSPCGCSRSCAPECG